MGAAKARELADAELAADHPLLCAEDRVELLRFMMLARAVEERTHNLYRQGKVPGSFYDGLGQEAIPAGVTFALAPRDRIAPHHRDMGAHLVRGTEPARIFGQYMARAGGVTEGRDSNTSFGDPHRGCVGHVSHLGDMVAVANGIAAGIKLRGEERCVATFFGDGATSRGDVHETMNWAGLHKLPLILVLEDNGFAYSTPTSMQWAVHPVHRAAGYGFPGVEVDGNDVEAVFEAAHAARRRALAGEGPTLLSCKTMRIHGHGAHDDQSYVPEGLIEEWAERDPIALQSARVTEIGLDVAAVEASVRELIDAETEVALAMEIPSGDTPRPVFATEPRLLGDEAPARWSGFRAGADG
jgi:TPP-dependent pyruvate/acetoin dehydrogenase alpha subunit